MDNAEAVAELIKVADVLHHTQRLLAGIDQARAAVELATEPRYTPLRTKIEHGQQSLDRVMTHLRGRTT